MPFNLPLDTLFYITGGVGLALCLLSIILTAIFHANYKPKRIPLIMFALGFVLFMGTGFAHWYINNLPEKDDTQEILPVGTTVDSGLLNVSVTLPAYLFQDEDMSDFNAKKYAERNDYKEATLNDDGSVTVKMSKGTHKEKTAEMLAQLEEMLAGMANGEKTPYVKSVIWTKTYDEIIITVDKEGYEEASDNPAYTVGMSVTRYLVFNGDGLYSEVIVKDVGTGDTFSDEIYPDIWEDGYVSPAGPENALVPPEVPEASSSGTLGNYDVEIKDASVITDYDGVPAIIITYEWTNNSENTVSADDALTGKAYQDGVQLDEAFIGDVSIYNSELFYRELDPGETFDVQCAFELVSDSSVVEFELSELSGSSDDVVAAEFDPSTLG